MAKAQAVEKQKAMRVASKKITPVPKHVPAEQILSDRSGTSSATSGVGQSVVDSAPLSEEEMQAIHAGRRATDPVVLVPIIAPKGKGSDSQDADAVVESGFSIFNQSPPGAPDMTEAQTATTPELKFSEAAAAKAVETQAKIAAKADKMAAVEAKKKQQIAELADKKAAREAKIAENKAARDSKAAELKEAGKGYVGSMLSLADRVKAGVYVKGMTGQLRSGDELALALDAVPPAHVIQLGLKALNLAANPYAHLNVGQQSMNLRNKMRGAIKAGTLTIDAVKEIRDKDGLATAEAEVAKKAEAKAEREAKRKSDKQAKQDLADGKAQAQAEPEVKAEPEPEALVERAPIGEQSTQVKSGAKREKAKA